MLQNSINWYFEQGRSWNRQKSYGCLVPGSVEGKPGWGFEQSGLVEGVPDHCGAGWNYTLRSLSFQTMTLILTIKLLRLYWIQGGFHSDTSDRQVLSKVRWWLENECTKVKTDLSGCSIRTWNQLSVLNKKCLLVFFLMMVVRRKHTQIALLFSWCCCIDEKLSKVKSLTLKVMWKWHSSTSVITTFFKGIYS